jgi:Tfp pilus assembly protein PilN
MESPDGFDANDFMVNIGLALKELWQEREGANFSLVNFNALPEVYQPKVVSLTSILSRVGIIVGIVLMIGMGFLTYSRAEYSSLLRSQLAPVNNSIATQIEAVATLQDQIKEVEAELGPLGARAEVFTTTLASLKAGREQAINDLVDVINLMPVNIDLTGINHEGESVSVRGVAKTEDDVFSYARNLSDSFDSVIISSIQAVEESGWITGFEFELYLK